MKSNFWEIIENSYLTSVNRPFKFRIEEEAAKSNCPLVILKATLESGKTYFHAAAFHEMPGHCNILDIINQHNSFVISPETQKTIPAEITEIYIFKSALTAHKAEIAFNTENKIN